MSTDDRVLSCGHPPSPHEPDTTGTAHTPDGQEICWACADALQIAELRTADHVIAYLSHDKDTDEPILTTWVGGKLAAVTKLTTRKVGSGGRRVYFRAVDVHGQHWFGSSPGYEMYARMHRSVRRMGG